MLSEEDRCVIETLAPSGGAMPGAFAAGYSEFHEDFERSAPPTMVWGFRAALRAAAWVAPLLAGTLPPLSRHGQAEREAILEGLGRSRFYLMRQLLLLLKAVVSFSYGADPAVRKAVGFTR